MSLRAWLRRGEAHVLAASRWLRAPSRARADMRSAGELARRTRAGPAEVEVPELTAAAARAAELGRIGLARELYEAAAASDGAPPILGALRRLPGYTPPVSPALVARAAEVAFGPTALRAGEPIEVRPLPPGWGLGGGVEGIARHDFGRGRTLIRKTFREAEPREVSAYRSGLLDTGGRWWRAPRMYLAAEEEGRRWHLFTEDLGHVRPPRTARALALAARALGELNSVRIDDPALVERVAWIGQPPKPPRFARPVRAAALLTGTIDDDIAARVVRTLETFAERRRELVRACAALPVVFCHGDPSPGNLHTASTPVVLLDWGVCGPGAVGSDLGSLFRLPGRHVADDVVQRCLVEYRHGLTATSGAALAGPEQVELGFLQRFVSMSLRRQLTQLAGPPDAETAGRADPRPLPRWSFRRGRWSAERNLARICDRADRLLDLLGT